MLQMKLYRICLGRQVRTDVRILAKEGHYLHLDLSLNAEPITRDKLNALALSLEINSFLSTLIFSTAEDVVDAAIKHGQLNPSSGCATANLSLIGAYDWKPSLFVELAQSYVRKKKTMDGTVVPGTMDTAIAKHLSCAYGSMAKRVASIAHDEDLGKMLAHDYPYLEAEVAYCVRHEYCETTIDFIARRTRLAFLDTGAASQALPRVIAILAVEHGWDRERQEQEHQNAEAFLCTFKAVVTDLMAKPAATAQ